MVWKAFCDELDLHAYICNVGSTFLATDYMRFLQSQGAVGPNMSHRLVIYTEV